MCRYSLKIQGLNQIKKKWKKNMVLGLLDMWFI